MKQIFTMDVEEDIDSAVDFAGLLRKHRVRGEFYITGELVEKYPEKCREIAKHHTIGGHGYNHENFARLSYNEAEKVIKKTIDIFKKNKIKIEGWRFPGFKFRNNQLKILVKYGLYDSSIRDTVLKMWGFFIFIWNLLSNIKRGVIFIPAVFPKALKERPWSAADLNNKQFYRKSGRLVAHCYNYKHFKGEFAAYLNNQLAKV